MQYQIKNAQGQWVNGMPTENCQHYRFFTDSGSCVESYWSVPEEPEES